MSRRGGRGRMLDRSRRPVDGSLDDPVQLSTPGCVSPVFSYGLLIAI